jgi:hypothetical protein
LHSDRIQTCRKNKSLYLRLCPCRESFSIDDIRRVSVSSGETLAQWSSRRATQVLQENEAEFVDDMAVDQYSGNAVIVVYYVDAVLKCKLIEFSEGGQVLKTYEVNELLHFNSICWRHGPDDDRPARLTFISSDDFVPNLRMADWTPNLSITKVDH